MRFIAVFVALSVANWVVGCGPKRTELGYGFYRVGPDIVRRVPSDDGKIVDENWWPSRFSGDWPPMVIGTSRGSHHVWVELSKVDLVSEKFTTKHDLDEYLQNHCTLITLDISIPEYQELGTYTDTMATLDPEDPRRELAELSYSMALGFAVWGSGLNDD